MNLARSVLAVCVLFVGAAVAAQQPSERFRRWDRNQDGKATRDELPRPAGLLFDRIDADKDGSISPDEERSFAERFPNLRPQRTPVPPTVRSELDLPYADTDNPRQRLDLYLPNAPESKEPLPLVAFVHGGGWRAGDKRGGYATIAPLVESGNYACASIGYRLTDEAVWPAQIHDCKAAIRWLRGNAKKYHLDPDRIGVIGNSAGGHLVAMLGTSGDVAELEGSLGEFPKVSSRVQCVVDQFGPSDFMALRTGARGPLAKLLGGTVDDHQEAARSASPITHVSQGDPPFMMVHGTKDQLVPFQQSELLQAALKKAGVEALLIAVTDASHGRFASPEVAERIGQFFDKHLRGRAVEISAEPIAEESSLRPAGD